VDSVLNPSRAYIGSSHDIVRRRHQHLNGSGATAAAGLTVSLPLLTTKVVGCMKTRELLETLANMRLMGIANVKGAQFLSDSLQDYRSAFKAIVHQYDLCAKCGGEGHYISACTKADFIRWTEPF